MTGRDDSVAGLDALTRAGLGARFQELFGRPIPKSVSRTLLCRIIAYRLQEIAAGGPNRTLRQRLAKLARELQATGTVTSAPAPQIKPGTRFLREWQGENSYRDSDGKRLPVPGQDLPQPLGDRPSDHGHTLVRTRLLRPQGPQAHTH